MSQQHCDSLTRYQYIIVVDSCTSHVSCHTTTTVAPDPSPDISRRPPAPSSPTTTTLPFTFLHSTTKALEGLLPSLRRDLAAELVVPNHTHQHVCDQALDRRLPGRCSDREEIPFPLPSRRRSEPMRQQPAILHGRPLPRPP